MNHLFEKAEKARQSSKFGEARKVYREIVRKSSTPQDQAEALLGLADVERIMGFFIESMRHYKQAERFIRILDPVSMTDAQMGWALAARAVGRPTEALRELKKALAFYKKQKDRQGEAFAHWALGGTFPTPTVPSAGSSECWAVTPNRGDITEKPTAACGKGRILLVLPTPIAV